MLLLAVACGMSPSGMAIVLPALPQIAEQFDKDYAQVQWVVSGYLLGIALAQPLIGFLSDRFGRRPVFLGGCTLFVLTSLALSAASSLPQLVLLRVLQAVGFLYAGDFTPVAALIAAAVTLAALSWLIVRGYDTVPKTLGSA